jgi:hypothetical protein
MREPAGSERPKKVAMTFPPIMMREEIFGFNSAIASNVGAPFPPDSSRALRGSVAVARTPPGVEHRRTTSLGKADGQGKGVTNGKERAQILSRRNGLRGRPACVKPKARLNHYALPSVHGKADQYLFLSQYRPFEEVFWNLLWDFDFIRAISRKPFEIKRHRMGRDSNPRYLAVHTLSRRAQSTALAPIQDEPETFLRLRGSFNLFSASTCDAASLTGHSARNRALRSD